MKALLGQSGFARNWSILVVSNVLGQGLGMVAMIRIARVLAPAGYGQYNIVQTVAALGLVVTALGTRPSIIRACARQPEQSSSIFAAAAGPRLAALMLVGFGALGYTRLGGGSDGPFLLLTVLLLAALTAWDLIESVAFGRERMEHSAAINLGGSTLWAAAAWLVPVRWLTPASVTLAFAGLQVAEASVYLALGRRFGYARPAVRAFARSWSTAGRPLLVASLPFFWLALLTAATNQLPILFLERGGGYAQVGQYNAALRLLTPLQILTTTALAALYPRLSWFSQANAAEFGRVVGRALLGMTIVGTGGALAVSLLRREVVVVLFGPAYLGAADVMAYQCWYAVLLAIFSLIGNVLAARDQQRKLAWLATAYAIVATPILWVGAQRGAVGLAQGILLAAVLNLSYHWIAFQRALPDRLPTRTTLALAGTIAGGIALGLVVAPSFPLGARLGLVPIDLAVTGAAWWLAERSDWRARLSPWARPSRALGLVGR